MRNFLKQNGIWVLFAGAVIAAALALMSFFSASSSPLANVTGVLAAPFRAVYTSVATWFNDKQAYYKNVTALEEENAALKKAIAEMEETVRQAQASHFKWDPEEQEFTPDKAWFAIKTVQLPYEYNWPMTHRALEASIKLIEAQWAEESEAVEDTYRKLKEKDEEAAKNYLSDYTIRQAEKAIEWARGMAAFFADDFWREDQYGPENDR